MLKIKLPPADSVNISGFRPDYGDHCHREGKTAVDISVLHFAQQLMQACVMGIPQRQNEFTMEIAAEGKTYCATFKFKPGTWFKISEALRQGKHMTWHIQPGREEQSYNGERFRVIAVTRVNTATEGYTVGGDFRIMAHGHSVTLSALAQAWDKMKQDPVHVELETA